MYSLKVTADYELGKVLRSAYDELEKLNGMGEDFSEVQSILVEKMLNNIQIGVSHESQ